MYKILGWTSQAASNSLESVTSKVYGWSIKEAGLEAYLGNYGSGWQHADREDNKWEYVLDCEVDYACTSQFYSHC